jgi:hypothetical protein
MDKNKAKSILYALRKIAGTSNSSSSNFRKLAEEGVWDDALNPGTTRTPGATWNVDGGGGGAAAVNAAADIKGMQQAIKTFASTMVAYKTRSVYDPATKKAKEVVIENDKRKDFNDFLAEQYSAGSSIKGQEWTRNVSATTRESKLPTDIIELDNVIDGLRRMGTQKNEAMIDGIWDWRTQNAVKNVWALADALVRVTDDFGAKLANPFTRSDLQALGNAIPKTDDIGRYPAQKKSQSAKIIKPLVEKLTSFYNSYYKTIIESPEYSSYIKQDLPLVSVTVGGQNPAAIPRELQQVAKENNNLVLTNVTVPLPNFEKDFSQSKFIAMLPIKPYLESKEGLQKLMLQVGYSKDDIYNNEYIAKVLKALLSHAEFAENQAKQSAQADIASVTIPYSTTGAPVYPAAAPAAPAAPTTQFIPLAPPRRA